MADSISSNNNNDNDIKSKVRVTDGETKVSHFQAPEREKKQTEQKHTQLKMEPQATGRHVFKFAYDYEDRTPVVDTDEYEISEIFFKNKDGFTLWTTVHITLKSESHTMFWANEERDMKYTIEEGEGWFLLGSKGEIVQAGKQILVPTNTMHMVLNNSTQPLIFRIECNHPLDLRAYLGSPQKQPS